MPPLKNWQRPLMFLPLRFITIWESLALLVKKTTLYQERDEEKRQAFTAEIEQIDPEDLVYMDESGIDPGTIRDYARAPRGKQVISDVCGKREKRTSRIAAWLPQAKSLIAPFAFEGSTDAHCFNSWLEQCLLPVLRKGQVITMDNAPPGNDAWYSIGEHAQDACFAS